MTDTVHGAVPTAARVSDATDDGFTVLAHEPAA